MEKKVVKRKDNKVNMSTRIDAKLFIEFSEVVENYGMTKSAFVEKAIRNYLITMRDNSRLF